MIQEIKSGQSQESCIHNCIHWSVFFTSLTKYTNLMFNKFNLESSPINKLDYRLCRCYVKAFGYTQRSRLLMKMCKKCYGYVVRVCHEYCKSRQVGYLLVYWNDYKSYFECWKNGHFFGNSEVFNDYISSFWTFCKWFMYLSICEILMSKLLASTLFEHCIFNQPKKLHTFLKQSIYGW